jgi:hypothetical protein
MRIKSSYQGINCIREPIYGIVTIACRITVGIRRGGGLA